MKHQDIISQMTLQEKAMLCSGKDFWHLAEIERLGIPSILVTDGPHGLRKQKEKKEKGELMSSRPAVCFPTAVTTASSWNPELIYKMGEALGEECLEEQVSVILGPGVNIKRSPLCGRNFEYFSEDPYLAGKMGASFVNGVQSKGVGTSLKHYAANNQETRRMTVDSVVDERTLREIYLAPFETVVKEAQPWTVMNAYNRLNGTYCAEHKWLLNDVLRDEWGFEGIVVTDWGANNDKVEGVKAGQDLEMPTSFGIAAKKIEDAVNNGTLDIAVLDKSVDKILDLILKSKANLKEFKYDKAAHHALARRIAGESMVLLKNNGILPLDTSKKIAVIGEMAKATRYQGAGSSLINPTQLDNSFDELTNNGVNMIYAKGYDKKTDKVDDALIAEAVEAAKQAEIALLFIGLTESYEAEGFDRTHLRLPDNHNALIEAVTAVCDKVVVVLEGGSPVMMPWLDKVDGVLNAYLGGQAAGSAIVDILLGKVNPSGKLAETYPLSLEENPSYPNFPGSPITVEYREGIYVGYRYYDTAKKNVLFPFGYGLSYTSFEYSDIKLSADSIKDTDTVTVSFKIKNTGALAGAEVAQVYVNDENSTIFRPEKELKGFKKVFLNPGEEKEVTIELSKRAFAFYNVELHDWQVESGKFNILVGASSRDIKLSAAVSVESTCSAAAPDYSATAANYYKADIMSVPDEQFKTILGREIPNSQRDKSIPLGINNTLEDSMDGKAGAKICKLIKKIMAKMPDDGNKAMMEAMALQIPIRCMMSMSMGVFSEKMANGLLIILNDQGFFKGLGKILSGIGNALKNMKNLFNSI